MLTLLIVLSCVILFLSLIVGTASGGSLGDGMLAALTTGLFLFLAWIICGGIYIILHFVVKFW